MSARYAVLAGPFRDEVVVQRSRFLTTLERIESIEAAEEFVARVAREFPDASHHCWAFVLGPPGSTAQVGMSDAGEPSGTAGRPMLNALVHGGVGDVAAVCSRWFGGTKLGTGGLVRAYGGAVKEALAAAPRTERVEWAVRRLAFPYARLDALKRLYPRHEVELLDEAFAAEVEHRVRLPVERLAGFEDAVREESAGGVLVRPDPAPDR
ncbi:MAG: YigZ family protein [Planctomycetota bacterium JB042]